MALAVAHVGGNAATGSGTITSDSWTSTAGSDIIVIAHSTDDASGSAADGDVTDSMGNTYTLLGAQQASGGSGVAIYHSNDTTRGASHTVTFNPIAGTTEAVNIAVIEITGQDQSADFDATTFAVATDAASPFDVTAAAAIAGNQIAIYGCTLRNNVQNFGWTQPAGYTNINNRGDGSTGLLSDAAYKLLETGTPTVGGSGSWSDIVDGAELFATFKEASGSLSLDLGKVASGVTVYGVDLVLNNQKVAPTADSVDGAWLNESGSNVNLYASVDEGTASDSDYIESESAPASSSVRLKLDPGLTDPASSTGHVLHWRVGKDATGGAQIDVTLDLYQGGGNVAGAGTLIATRTHTDVDALTTYDETLTGTEADAITNYGDLYVEITATQV